MFIANSKRTARQKDHQCKDCRKKFTVRTRTIFERSHISLEKWLYAMYLVQTCRKGVSSLEMSKELGITQKSAWFMLQWIREACGIKGELLQGVVEIDETYVGGKEKNKHANKKTQGTQGRNTAVVGLKQRNGRVKAKMFNEVTSNNLQKYIDENVGRGSILSTDEARFYKPIKNYKRAVVNHSVKEYVQDTASTNSIESVWALLKRGYYGTFHHFSKKHIDRYVNEFTFRLNEGNSKSHILDTIDVWLDNTINKRLTYKEFIKC